MKKPATAPMPPPTMAAMSASTYFMTSPQPPSGFLYCPTAATKVHASQAATRQNREPVMSLQMILAPLFVQVLLTLVILFTLGGRRLGAVRRGELEGPVSLREGNWPIYARQAE